MKKKYLLLVYFIVLHFITSSAQNADRCSDILALGFYGETKTFNSGNEVKDFKSFFEEDKLREYLKNKGSGFNLGVPIKGVTLKLNAESTNAEFQKVKDYINKGNTSNINKAYINFITQQIVDKNVVDAWSKCMGDNSGKIGLQGSYDGDMNDNYFTLIISFASRMGVNSCELSYVDVRGADYDKTFLQKGQVITSEPIRVPIIRDGNAAIHVTVNSNNGGSFRIDIPAKVTDFRNETTVGFGDGKPLVEYEAGYPGKISVEEAGGTLTFSTDKAAIGFGIYTIPLKIDPHSKWVELFFSDNKLTRSSSLGNTTLLQLYLSKTEEFHEASTPLVKISVVSHEWITCFAYRHCE